MSVTTSPTNELAELAHLSAPFSPDAVSELVVAPAGSGPGSWAGAPSALLHDGVFYLAYRLRQPIGRGRGIANIVARSRDGVRFTTVATLHKEAFGAESLERPAIAVTPEGGWRAYISVATPGTKHWRVDLVEAATPEGLATAIPHTILPGSADLAVKDPVVVQHAGRWHLWASVHPLDDPEATDRMTSEYASSDDGVAWTWHGTALRGRIGTWDARGTRVAAVRLDQAEPIAYYDGRATAEENWEERTGVARIAGLDSFEAIGDAPVAMSPFGLGGLRYVSAVRLPDGDTRLYYEVTRPDGAHELRTTLVKE
jgi:hypothetical protein